MKIRFKTPFPELPHASVTVSSLLKLRCEWSNVDAVFRCFEDLGRWATIVKDNQADNLPDWESVAKHASCNVWQKAPVGEKSPEYRACGSFHDLPARIFYKTQLDLAYRRQWDKLVIKLEIIDKDTETGTETIQWVSQFPVICYL